MVVNLENVINKEVNEKERYLLHQEWDKGYPQKGPHLRHQPRVGQDGYKLQDLQYEGRRCNPQHKGQSRTGSEYKSYYEQETLQE